jgi:2-oxoglutarate ferredoxin oxidoreductase subunit gamma
MKKERFEVILAGSGGQGLVLSGIMLAEAGILEGKNAVQTVSYGIATRGGFSMAEVILDPAEIIFQQVLQPDVVLVLTEEAMEKFQPAAARGTSVFYDTTLVGRHAGERFHGHPFTAMADRIGHVGMANIIALGCIAEGLGVVSVESLARIVRRHFKGAVGERNLEALAQGARLAGDMGI